MSTNIKEILELAHYQLAVIVSLIIIIDGAKSKDGKFNNN